MKLKLAVLKLAKFCRRREHPGNLTTSGGLHPTVIRKPQSELRQGFDGNAGYLVPVQTPMDIQHCAMSRDTGDAEMGLTQQNSWENHSKKSLPNDHDQGWRKGCLKLRVQMNKGTDRQCARLRSLVNKSLHF